MRARDAYLDRESNENVKSTASRHAQRLSALLLRFMTPPYSDLSSHDSWGFPDESPKPRSWSYLRETVHEDLPPPPKAPSTVTNETARVSVLRPRAEAEKTDPNHFLIEWEKNLTKIFEAALKLRIKMARRMDVTWSFDFPFPTAVYERCDSKGNMLDREPAKKTVMLGQLPAVYLRMPSNDYLPAPRVACAPFKAYSYNN